MKKIGLIGGTSWNSTLEYYRLINEMVNERLGGLHSAKIVLESIDFEYFTKFKSKKEHEKASQILIDAARNIEKAGADMVLICANTPHEYSDKIEHNIMLPLIHIVDETAKVIHEHNIRKAGLLGTKFTMTGDFYNFRMERQGIEILRPDDAEMEKIHEFIYSELCYGIIKDSTKNDFKKYIRNLVDKGAEGIILGCTEIPLIIKQEDSPVPVFDTTSIHAKAAVDFALE